MEEVKLDSMKNKLFFSNCRFIIAITNVKKITLATTVP